MTFAAFLTWNRFNGSYFKDGVDIQGDLTIQPTYKLITDTVVGSTTTTVTDSVSGVITTSTNVTISSTLTLLKDIIVNSVNITPTILSYLSTLSSNVQTQINTINSAITALQGGTLFFTGLLTAAEGIKNGANLLMKANGGNSILFTTDGGQISTTNCIGRLFGTTTQMYLDFNTNFLFRSTNLSNSISNDVFQINSSNSSFYNPLTTNTLTNNGVLTQNGSLVTSGVPTFIGSGNGTLPSSSTGGLAGLSIYWNTSNGSGETCLLNMGQGGSGGYAFYSSSNSSAPKCIMYIDYLGNISKLNDISFSGKLIASGTSISSTILSYLSTLSSNVQTQINSINTTLDSLITGAIFDSLIVYGSISCDYIYGTYCSFPKIVTNKIVYDSSLIIKSASLVSDSLTLQSTAMNINVNTAISGSLTANSIASSVSMTTPAIYSPFLNNSKYITIRGYSYKSSGTTQYNSPGTVSYAYKSSIDQGTTTYTGSTFTFPIPDDCLSICSQYSYYSTGTNSFQGITPYYYMKYTATSFTQTIGTTIGSYNCQPSGNVSYSNGSFNYNGTFCAASNNNDYIYFTFNIWFY